MRTIILTAGLFALAAQAGSPAQAALPAQQAPREVVRSGVTYVTTDLVVRNDRGGFVANLGRNDFEVYEDGVKQEIVTFVLTHGGRVLHEVPPPNSRQEGVLLPPARPPNDSSGRVFLIFLDDLHMTFRDTARVRAIS